MRQITTLDKLKIGQKAVIRNISVKSNIRRRLIDIGLVRNTIVECVLISPLGEPCAYLIRGAVIALRSEESSQIEIALI